MRRPPPQIPAANSAKWHNRRWWDSLGYLRVRTLANPGWQRDVGWLTQVLVREAASQKVKPGEGPYYQVVITVLRRYPRTAAGERDPEAAWDEVLAAIDELLVYRDNQHRAQVRKAQEALHPDPDGRPSASDSE